MILKTLTYLCAVLIFSTLASSQPDLMGAWRSDNGALIISGNYLTYAAYKPNQFEHTYGGTWEHKNGKISLTYEFHTQTPAKVGTTESIEARSKNSILNFGGISFRNIDDGTPGELNGSWIFSNRYRDGKLGNARSADNPRKTMKILSGKRFQWIAFNVETKEFMGTGGGTYSTTNRKYTENIEFFSRDNNRVGASLEFNFEIAQEDWHHKGLSSKGQPIHEIWSERK